MEPSHRFPDTTFVIPNYQLGFILKSFALIILTAVLGSQWLRLTNHSTQENILNICIFTQIPLVSCFAASWLQLMPTCSSNLTLAQRAWWHQSAQFPPEMRKPSAKPLLNLLFASDYRVGTSTSAWRRVPTSPSGCLLLARLLRVARAASPTPRSPALLRSGRGINPRHQYRLGVDLL